MTANKFSDIGNRRSADDNALSRVISGGQVEIKSGKSLSSSSKKSPIQVMLDPEVKRGIKALAAMHGMTMTELFEEMYTHYIDTHERMKS